MPPASAVSASSSASGSPIWNQGALSSTPFSRSSAQRRSRTGGASRTAPSGASSNQCRPISVNAGIDHRQAGIEGDGALRIEAEIVAAAKPGAARRVGTEQNDGVRIALRTASPCARAARRRRAPEGIGIGDQHRIGSRPAPAPFWRRRRYREAAVLARQGKACSPETASAAPRRRRPSGRRGNGR